MKRIYLDHAATTPLAATAREAMLPFLESQFGNPSSLYLEGRTSRQATDSARVVISEAMDCLFAEIAFTSSGTEAAVMAIIGACLAHQGGSRNRLVFGAIEHHCVLSCQKIAERLGYRVNIAPVDHYGRIDIDSLANLMGNDILLVAVQHANNEIGTVQPIDEVLGLCKRFGALSFCDAIQTFGTYPVPDADLTSLSAHKVNGPKGVGALRVRAGTKIEPILAGGGQERELRGGTENVAGIVGFGAAVTQLQGCPDGRQNARSMFVESLDSKVHDYLVWTTPLSWGENSSKLLPGHVHFRFPGIKADSMLVRLDRLGVSASSGAACSSGSLEASHVMMACGYDENAARESLRFTFGRESTVDDAIEAALLVAESFKAIKRS